MRVGKWEYRQLTVFVEDMGTEIREGKGSSQRLVCEMKHVWVEAEEAEVASKNHSKTMKTPETKV